MTAAVGPYTSSQYVPHSYGSSYGGATRINGQMGLVSYDGMRGDAAAAVLANLPAGHGELRQNDSPTTAVMLRAAAEHPGEVELGGYLVGPDRLDERVSVESMMVYADQDSSPAVAWPRASVRFGLDADADPDESHLVENPWRPGEKCWRYWWD